jgi:hypothetical protein
LAHNSEITMTLKSFLISLGIVAITAATGPAAAEQVRGARLAAAAEVAAEKTCAYRRKRPPLEIDIYAQRRRPGGYSYRVPDITSTYSYRNPPPYAHVRQTPSGPFDSGFFFDSGIAPRAGDAPYPH